MFVGVAPRRFISSVRQQYLDIEERIARVTDSKRTDEDLLFAINGPLSSRETRMEAVAWIVVCQFNCRIFGGFVRDWIIGGYSAKPTVDTDLSAWITYTHYWDCINGEQKIPHINKQFVPNDIDCYLPDDGFNIDQFLAYLRIYDIACSVLCKMRYHDYVLLLDEYYYPFTMDLISTKSASKFNKYRFLDADVNNLYVEKDFHRALGMRYDPACNQLSKLGDLETTVKNIKDKRFRVMRSFDVEDRIEKLSRRGWIRLEADTRDDHGSTKNEYNNDHSSRQ